jgi:opacity protein-like surface antigen
MKKLMMIATMMVATLSASAQFAPGTFSLQPKVGVDLAKISFDDSKFKFGLAAGIEGQYQINDWFGLAAAVMYQQQGSKIKDIDLKYNTEYLNIPVTAKFYVAKGLSLNAGLQLGFLTKAKEKEYDLDVKDLCNKVDFSIPLGVGYEFENGLAFDFRYNLGLSNVFNKDKMGNLSTLVGDASNKNQVLMLTVGYKFGL